MEKILYEVLKEYQTELEKLEISQVNIAKLNEDIENLVEKRDNLKESLKEFSVESFVYKTKQAEVEQIQSILNDKISEKERTQKTREKELEKAKQDITNKLKEKQEKIDNTLQEDFNKKSEYETKIKQYEETQKRMEEQNKKQEERTGKKIQYSEAAIQRMEEQRKEYEQMKQEMQEAKKRYEEAEEQTRLITKAINNVENNSLEDIIKEYKTQREEEIKKENEEKLIDEARKEAEAKVQSDEQARQKHLQDLKNKEEEPKKVEEAKKQAETKVQNDEQARIEHVERVNPGYKQNILKWQAQREEKKENSVSSVSFIAREMKYIIKLQNGEIIEKNAQEIDLKSHEYSEDIADMKGSHKFCDRQLLDILAQIDKEKNTKSVDAYMKTIQSVVDNEEMLPKEAFDLSYDLKGISNADISKTGKKSIKKLAKNASKVGIAEYQKEDGLFKRLFDRIRVKKLGMPSKEKEQEDNSNAETKDYDINGKELETKEISELEAFRQRLHAYSAPDIAAYVNAYLTQNEKSNITQTKTEYLEELRKDGVEEEKIQEISQKIDSHEIKKTEPKTMEK